MNTGPLGWQNKQSRPHIHTGKEENILSKTEVKTEEEEF